MSCKPKYFQAKFKSNKLVIQFLQAFPSPGWNPIFIEIPWDPTLKNGIAERTSNYYCKPDFYVNIIHTTGILTAVTVSDEVVDNAAHGSWSYKGRECVGVGAVPYNGIMKARYTCFCDTKCQVLVQVRHSGSVNGKLCTVNVYD